MQCFSYWFLYFAKQYKSNNMKIRPSMEYWDTLDAAIREKSLTLIYSKTFFFGLLIVISILMRSCAVIAAILL